MLTHNINYFKSKPDELPKTTILLDNGYHPELLTQAKEVDLSRDYDEDPI